MIIENVYLHWRHYNQRKQNINKNVIRLKLYHNDKRQWWWYQVENHKDDHPLGYLGFYKIEVKGIAWCRSNI